MARNPCLGWREMARGDLDVCDVPGDHESIFMKPHVAVLAQKLGEYLHETTPAAP